MKLHLLSEEQIEQNFEDIKIMTGNFEDSKIDERLEYLRGEIEAERISYSEIAELQLLAPYINKNDTQLLEWAGVPEKI